MGNTFGKLFRIATWGESHGAGIGVVIDGCPPGIPIAAEEIQAELDRRRPGQSSITTQRQEPDRVEILSGIFEGKTLGTPIALLVRNMDARSKDYEHLKDLYRPSHADYTYGAKYGTPNLPGGGRASARETIGRVAAGAIARKILALWAGVEMVAYVKRIHTLEAKVDPGTVQRAEVERTPVRCPDPEAARAMVERIEEMRRQGDSVGGVIELAIRGVPPGLGEPVFDRLEADLGKAMLSLPATKGFEVGSGFEGTRLTGSRHNDPFYAEAGRVRTRANRSGGIQGGISNGEDILCRIAFKPTATINLEQQTISTSGEPVTLRARGRHDPCVLPRAVPMVEAMAALVFLDHLLRFRAQCGWQPRQPEQPVAAPAAPASARSGSKPSPAGAPPARADLEE
ncbi:MAG: chorismate synthase [Planctomycetes bacterium]|nr:chorismate synthase [Planctomycetota bacterium]